MKHEFARLGSVTLHYVEAGSGHLVIFLHGFPEFWYAWRRQLDAVGKTHHAVAVDMRGYNLSSKPKGTRAYEATVVANDIIALADHLGAEKFTVVGHDWGGVIAWRLASLYPDRLDHLVIINAPHLAVMRRELLHNPKQQIASSYVLFLRMPGSHRILSASNFRMLRPILDRGVAHGYFDESDVAAYIAAWSEPDAMRGSVAYYKAVDLISTLRKRPATDERAITVPTLVIWGERDRYLLRGNLDGLEAYVKNLTVRRVPDASHWIVHEKPDLINKLLLDYLS
jgi:pimeloyl-ACP methyl ester carboxylesterase